MKISCAVAMALIVALALLSSCSSLRSGTAVKAGYDAEEKVPDRASDQPGANRGWAARHIPGWKTVGTLVPEPTEARTNWDNWMTRRNGPLGTELQ
jgi:uncharacterized protein YceK